MLKSNVYFKAIQLWKWLSCLIDWQQLLVHKPIQLILYFMLSWQHINFDCLCDQPLVHNSLHCLWVVNLEGTKYQQKLQIKCFALIMWDIFHSTLRCFVVSGCCIHHMFRDQRLLELHWQYEIKCQRTWSIHWGTMKSLWFRIYLYLIVTLYQCTQAIPGFDRGLIKLMRRALCDIFAASNSVWISYGGWWILYR